MKTYTIEELRLAQAKGCRIEIYDTTVKDWSQLLCPVELVRSPANCRIHPADEWKARLPRLKEGAEWACDGNEHTNLGCRPYIVGELIEGMTSLRAFKGTDGRIDLPIPPEFLHPDELAKQPEAAQATDFGEPWHPSYSKGSEDKENDWVFEARSNDYRTRIIACVNALRGVPDPAEFVRQAKENAEILKRLGHH
jgi:hypothetical protein